MAIVNNITVYKGESIQLDFTMPVGSNITGWTIVFSLKLHGFDATPLATVEATVTSATTFNVALDHSITNITAKDYVYDVQRTDSGDEAVLSIGIFKVTQEVLYP